MLIADDGDDDFLILCCSFKGGRVQNNNDMACSRVGSHIGSHNCICSFLHAQEMEG